MIAAFTYCRMEFKRACRIFPIFMAGAIVLAVLLGTIALLAGKVLYGETALGRIQTGVVLPENDRAARQALSMLSSMDSVESICDFRYITEEEGIKGLKQGKLSALLLIPKDFIQSIMDGTNRQITVVLPENPGIEARVMREMTEAGTRTLKSAQAGIYAADAWCIREGKRELIPQTEADLNRIYLKYAMDREIYFRKNRISAAGDMTAGEHFGICFLVMFLILGGIPLSGFFRQGKTIFYKKLKMSGIGEGTSTAVQILALSCVYGAALAVLGALGGFFFPSIWASLQGLTLPGLWGIFLTAMAASAIIVAVYELCGSRMAGMIALFWGSIVMMFLAGGILPSAFLPEALKKLGEFMPAAYMIDGMEKAVFSGWGIKETGRMAGLILISWGIAAAGRKSHG
ncbi:ABC transporter permease [Lachnospiraceae bacterium 62-35]